MDFMHVTSTGKTPPNTAVAVNRDLTSLSAASPNRIAIRREYLELKRREENPN